MAPHILLEVRCREMQIRGGDGISLCRHPFHEGGGVQDPASVGPSWLPPKLPLANGASGSRGKARPSLSGRLVDREADGLSGLMS